MKIVVSQLARGGLMAQVLALRVRGHIAMPRVKLKLKTLREVAHEIVIRVGGGTSNPVIKVDNGKHQPLGVSQVKQ
jgi:hypothetical protein